MIFENATLNIPRHLGYRACMEWLRDNPDQDPKAVTPGYVYVLVLAANGLRWVKVGSSYDLSARINGFNLIRGAAVVKSAAVLFESKRLAHTVELCTHAAFRPLGEDHGAEMGNGGSECYHESAFTAIRDWVENHPLALTNTSEMDAVLSRPKRHYGY